MVMMHYCYENHLEEWCEDYVYYIAVSSDRVIVSNATERKQSVRHSSSQLF